MGPILPFLRPHDLFDADTLAMLSEAFVKSLASVNETHLPAALTREVVATAILDAASVGERQIEKLREAGVKALRKMEDKSPLHLSLELPVKRLVGTRTRPLMWTLVLVIFVAAGTSTGGVSASSAFLDFSTEAKCRAALDGLTASDQISPNRGNHPNISPSATYRIIGRCVER